MPKLYTVSAGGENPYENLALESCLIEAAEPDAVVLYLWQNRRTVVIGRNQNAWAECRVDRLEGDGGFLARRPSGGGAVFQDLGNLNFSFVATEAHYDVGRQLDTVIRAVGAFGLAAERSGRNDVLAGGRKFSGNAFSRQGDRLCHHGTLMVQVDTEAMARYLSVSPLKLKAKGVESVRSRVGNLAELAPGLTVASLAEAMTAAFGREYGGRAEPLPEGFVDAARLAEITGRYASRAWRLGREVRFGAQAERRFDWGGFSLQMDVADGRVRDALCYTDALDPLLTEGLAEALIGCAYTPDALAGAAEAHAARAEESTARADALRDVAAWLREM